MSEVKKQNKVIPQHTGPEFPVVERHMERFFEYTKGKILFLAHPDWIQGIEALKPENDFDIRELNDETASLPEEPYETIVVATPQGEDEIAKKLLDSFRDHSKKPVVLRLLRDIFLRTSLKLGGDYSPLMASDTTSNKSLFIFAIPRSGSSFLSNIFAKTWVVGHPQEHLLIDQLKVFFNTDLTFDTWLEALQQFSVTKNGYSGTKLISHLFCDNLDFLSDNPERSDAMIALIKKSTVVYLKRKNVVRQAISLIKAKRSNTWHVRSKGQEKSDPGGKKIKGNFNEVISSVLYMKKEEQRMEHFFEQNNISPLTYYYEDFSHPDKLEPIFQEVLQACNVHFEGSIPTTEYRQMADETTEEIVAGFYKDLDDHLIGSKDLEEEVKEPIMSSLIDEYHNVEKTITQKEKKTRKPFWKF